MIKQKTISIAGAGPAGLTAAINLARAGYDVVVHEQHSDVGMCFSEDFQAIENWSSDEDLLATLAELAPSPTSIAGLSIRFHLLGREPPLR